MIRKWKKQRAIDNEDPLLLIEWDEVGVAARITLMHSTQKYL